jgi:tetratricopeptide (TPR) repeat protein
MTDDDPDRIDLAAQLEAARNAVVNAPDAQSLHDLGKLLLESYNRDGDPATLDEGIDLLSAVVSESPRDPVSGTDYRIGLGVALEARVWVTGADADADAAVALARSVLADTPDDTVDRLVARSNLSNALLTRYEAIGGSGYVAEAVTHAQAVADAFPAADPRRASMFANLSTALELAFGESGELADLSDAVDAARLGVRLAVPGDPGLPGYLLDLANSLFSLSEVSGDSALVDEAVTTARRAVAESTPGAARRALALTCLANSLRSRYELAGELAVLDEAIEADRAALDLTSPQEPHYATCRSNLAISLTLHHEHEADLAVLEEALEHARAGAAAASEGTPDRYLSLLTLGRTAYEEFMATDDRAALDCCIEAEREAGQEVGADSPGRPMALANLAASLTVRNEQADLEEAVSLLTQAVALTAAGSPDRAMYLYNLGEARARIAKTVNTSAGEAVEAFRAAAAVDTATPLLRAEAAMEWGMLSAADGDWRTAAQGFGLAVGLFSLISPRHFGREDQEHRLEAFAGLASDAAACTLAASDQAGTLEAITLLEQGRGVLVGHLLGDSADLTRVRAVAPQLAAEFEQLRDEFDLAGARQPAGELTSPRAVAAGMPENYDETLRRRDILRRRDEVVEKIRALDGLADFLCAPDPSQLLAAGNAGPFVMINISRYRCDAIIVHNGAIRAVRLPGVTAAGLAEVTTTYLRLFDKLRRTDELPLAQRPSPSDTLRDICGWLWDRIVLPVLGELGLPRRDGEVPRIWWCPTGSLALLPLHAACRYDAERDAYTGVADWAVSSYTVSARALLALRDRARVPVAGQSPLVVAMDQTPGMPALPQVAREVAVISAAVAPAARILRNDAATRSAVCTALARHPWFHFAGHSYQDLLHPARAGLCLGDGDLSALAIATQRLAGGELAYLSSCEGAIPGTQVPDEPLHLALAFQIAGYRNVVATLWPVNDFAAAKVTQAIYRRITRDGQIDADGTAQALRAVVLELRDRYPAEIWAAYLHVGA